MRDALTHRGPDDAGAWASADQHTVLGHRRLAIIDLSPGGHQPMQDHTRRYTLIFNGEIYNFESLRQELESIGQSFTRRSDSEVILEAYRRWGTDCVDHLNGMFAFAIYDREKDLIFAARDRAGEKPLYYWHHNNTLIFASELKALMLHPEVERRCDKDALADYLMYGYVSGGKSILTGVNKLRQGHRLIFLRARNRLKVEPYWRLPSPSSATATDPEELVDELENLLRSSVRRQMVSDVPIGVLLSGGTDSSVVTALASEVAEQTIKTFTVSFPNLGTQDEAPYAKLVADHFSTDHTVLPAERMEADLLADLARQYDEPLADHSMIPTFLVSRLIREHATVAVGGDGGDELFGGYQHYAWLIKQAKMRKFLPATVRQIPAELAHRFMAPGQRGRIFLQGLAGDTAAGFGSANHHFDARTRQSLLPGIWPEHPDKSPSFSRSSLIRSRQEHGLLHSVTAADFHSYMVDDVLVKVDRASMLTSLEVRAPILDHQIIEFAFARVPDTLKIHQGKQKILLRRLGERLLPHELELERKQGFAFPLEQWLRGEWREMMFDVLLSESCIFAQGPVRDLIEGLSRGMLNGRRLFCLMMFELWRREYKVAL